MVAVSRVFRVALVVAMAGISMSTAGVAAPPSCPDGKVRVEAECITPSANLQAALTIVDQMVAETAKMVEALEAAGGGSQAFATEFAKLEARVAPLRAQAEALAKQLTDPERTFLASYSQPKFAPLMAKLAELRARRPVAAEAPKAEPARIGARWQDLGLPCDKQANISEMVGDDQTLFVVAGPSSKSTTDAETLFRSVDLGKTWSAVYQSDQHRGWSQARIAARGNTVLFRANNGLLRSADGGKTWRNAGPDRLVVFWGDELLSAVPGSATVFASKDGGATWSRRIDAPAPIDKLAVSCGFVFVECRATGQSAATYRLDNAKWTVVEEVIGYYAPAALFNNYRGSVLSSSDGAKTWIDWSMSGWGGASFDASSSGGQVTTNVASLRWLAPGRKVVSSFSLPTAACYRLALHGPILLASCTSDSGEGQVTRLFALDLHAAFPPAKK